jgi:hypothetical protein
MTGVDMVHISVDNHVSVGETVQSYQCNHASVGNPVQSN